MYIDTHTLIECMNFEGLAKSLAAVMAFVICVSDWSGGTDASIGVFIELCTTIWFVEDHTEPQPPVWWWPNFALNMISLCKTLRCKKILFRCVLILLDFLIPGLCTNLCGNRSICNFLLRILLFCWSWIRLYSTSSHLRLRLVESWRRSMHLGWPPLCLLCMSMLVKISIWIHALNTFRYTECSRMLLGSIVHSNRLYDIVYVYITHTYWAQRNYWVVSRFVVSQDVRLRYMMPVHVNKIEIALLPSTWGNFSPCRPGLLLQMWPTRPTRTKHNLVSHKPSEGLLWAPLDGILESAKASLSEDWWSEISPGEHVSRKVSWHQKKDKKSIGLEKTLWFHMISNAWGLSVSLWLCYLFFRQGSMSTKFRWKFIAAGGWWRTQIPSSGHFLVAQNNELRFPKFCLFRVTIKRYKKATDFPAAEILWW